LAVFISPFLGIDKKGGFQYIQEYTGFVSPGIFAMFLMGLFWKKTTARAAMFATIGGFLFSIFLKFLPGFTDLYFLSALGFAKANAAGVYEIPFLDRMGFVFAFCVLGMVLISSIQNLKVKETKGLEIDAAMFKVDSAFVAGATIVIVALVALYAYFW